MLQPVGHDLELQLPHGAQQQHAASEKELQRFIDGNAHRVALDAVDAPTVLLEYAGELRAMQENWPKIKFHALREHAGLVFQKQLVG